MALATYSDISLSGVATETTRFPLDTVIHPVCSWQPAKLYLEFWLTWDQALSSIRFA